MECNTLWKSKAFCGKIMLLFPSIFTLTVRIHPQEIMLMPKLSFYIPLIALLTLSLNPKLQAQDFYFGNDLSYVNQMEDCGADFKEWGEPKDVYQIYADRGNNIVRVRLWVNPTWQKSIAQPVGVKEMYSNFEDAKETIQRAKEAGMQVLLDFHYSDFWADPGRQILPGDWYLVGGEGREDALADSVYNYTHRVLTKLETAGLMPEMVQVGNETNSGMMLYRTMNNNDYVGEQFISDDWSRHAKLFNAGIRAVRDVSDSSEVDTKIALHYAGICDLEWWFQNAIKNGITDFDVIGFSYYYAWHGGSIRQVGNQIQRLSQSYPDKEIIILETGYPWTDRNFDNNVNIINEFVEGYGPPSPSHQLAYLVNLTKEVMSSGGDGIIFWESAWVTTPCNTAWDKGSSHDDVVFFEPFTDNFIGSGGGLWMNRDFYEDMNSVQVVFKTDVGDQDVSDGVYITGDLNTDRAIETFRMYHEGDGIYSYTTYLSPDMSVVYNYQIGNGDGAVLETVPDSCSTGGSRSYTAGNENSETGYVFGSCESIVETKEEPQGLTVTFAVNMEGIDVSDGVYVTGDFTRINGSDWSIEPMEHIEGDIYAYTAEVEPGEEGGWYFLDGSDWSDREAVPSACVGYYNSDRGYFIEDESVTYAYYWSSCETFEYMPTSSEDENEIPGQGTLYQNYPNPFNPNTLITYEIPISGYVELSLYNLLGQEVKKVVAGYKNAGRHYVNLNAGDLPSGTYVYKLTMGDYTENRKLTLIK